jgi:hypothetical protein
MERRQYTLPLKADYALHLFNIPQTLALSHCKRHRDAPLTPWEWPEPLLICLGTDTKRVNWTGWKLG